MLNIGDIKPETRRGDTVDVHIDISASRKTLCQGGTDAWNLFCDVLDLQRHALDLGEVFARHFHPDRALDTGRQHVDAVTDRRNPHIGEAWHLYSLVQLFD